MGTKTKFAVKFFMCVIKYHRNSFSSFGLTRQTCGRGASDSCPLLSLRVLTSPERRKAAERIILI